MLRSFDRIVFAVPDLGSAMLEYQKLLGADFWCFKNDDGEAIAWIGLGNTVLELIEREVERASIVALVFAADGPGREIKNNLQLPLSICDGAATAVFRDEHSRAQNTALSVDHVVLRTSNAEACIALFSVGLGIRLALDKTVPEWGGRMLFFRLGKLTLEVIETTDEKPARDFFWGITYQCPNLAAMASRLGDEGIALSEIRDGRKPGTKVATVKSHSLEIPTMLIEPVSS